MNLFPVLVRTKSTTELHQSCQANSKNLGENNPIKKQKKLYLSWHFSKSSKTNNKHNDMHVSYASNIRSFTQLIFSKAFLPICKMLHVCFGTAISWVMSVNSENDILILLCLSLHTKQPDIIWSWLLTLVHYRRGWVQARTFWIHFEIKGQCCSFVTLLAIPDPLPIYDMHGVREMLLLSFCTNFLDLTHAHNLVIS